MVKRFCSLWRIFLNKVIKVHHYLLVTTNQIGFMNENLSQKPLSISWDLYKLLFFFSLFSRDTFFFVFSYTYTIVCPNIRFYFLYSHIGSIANQIIVSCLLHIIKSHETIWREFSSLLYWPLLFLSFSLRILVHKSFRALLSAFFNLFPWFNYFFLIL